jgi:hypothetical protein
MADGRDSGGDNRPRLAASGLRPDVAGGILSTLRSIPVTEDGPPGQIVQKHQRLSGYPMIAVTGAVSAGRDAPALWQAGGPPLRTRQSPDTPALGPDKTIGLPIPVKLG